MLTTPASSSTAVTSPSGSTRRKGKAKDLSQAASGQTTAEQSRSQPRRSSRSVSSASQSLKRSASPAAVDLASGSSNKRARRSTKDNSPPARKAERRGTNKSQGKVKPASMAPASKSSSSENSSLQRRTGLRQPSARRQSTGKSGDGVDDGSHSVEQDDAMAADAVEESGNAQEDVPDDVDEDEEEETDDEDADAHVLRGELDEAAHDESDDEMGGGYEDGDFMASDFASVAQLAGLFSGGGSRYREMLSSLRAYKDPTTQLIGLQELNEALSLANEETLAGHFATDSFTRELIYILGGPKPPKAGGASDDNSQDVDEDQVAALEAAGLVDKSEMTLLACRCLAHILEAMPHTASTMVAYGVIPVLLDKLTNIEIIDLAEQTLQTLEKLSAEVPTTIVSAGGLMAMLQYLDFFNLYIQRNAMTAAANCCRRLNPQHFEKVKEVIPIIRNVLGYSDQRLVDSGCKCVVRIIESFKYQPEHLEQLIDKELVQALNALLLHGSPAAPTAAGVSASTSIGASVFTDVLKACSSAVRASPRVAVMLLEANVVETLYNLLTGSPPPAEDGSGGRGPAASDDTTLVAPATQLEARAPSTSDEAPVAIVGQAGTAVADMAVLQNLAQRPKEQVHEALSLVSELLPPLPRDGIFNAHAYTEKAWHKRRKAAKEARSVAKDAAHSTSTSDEANAASDGDGGATATAAKPERTKTEKELMREQAQIKRKQMLTEQQALVKRFTQLVLPTLVEVYAASVALHMRAKALSGILKIISFVDEDTLTAVLDNVPLATFVASILSSRDDPSLVLSALQMAELLCNRLPAVYKSLLRREGVMWEIDDIAAQEPSTIKYGRPSASSDITGSGSSASAQPNAGESALSSAGTPNLPSEARSDTSRHSALQSLLGLSAPNSVLAVPAVDPSGPSKSRNSAEVQDSVIWRARILRDNFSRETVESDGGVNHATQALEQVKSYVSALRASTANGADEAKVALDQVTSLFSRPDAPISSFELLRSGLVDGFYEFAKGDSTELPLTERRRLILQALMVSDSNGNSRGAAIVKRLQESLNRLENVEITTAVSSATDDPRRSAISSLHRQLRLRLQADTGSGTPSIANNLVVGIHAIASFERLADFLRPRLSQALSAAANGTDPNASAAARAARLSSLMASLGGARSPAADRAALLSSSLAGLQAPPAAASGASDPAGANTASGSSAQNPSGSSKPRRSSRLSRKSSGGDDADTSAATTGAEGQDSASEPPLAETSAKAPAETSDETEQMGDDSAARRLMESLLDGGLEDDDDQDFEDEELGEEIFEDELDAPGAGESSVPEDKTVSLSVADDGKKVEAKTPEGTRIPTPSAGGSAGSTADASGAASSSAPRPSAASRPSYAAALQRKPSDWHLEFSMEGQPISLDTTIYAAIHDFENRPGRSDSTADARNATPQRIWNNIYTIKFKKVEGAAPKAAGTSDDGQTPEPAALQPLPDCIAADSSFAKVLQLLRVLHELNSDWRQLREGTNAASSLDEAQPLREPVFVNNKLTAKLNRQLEEPMIVASKCLPQWALQLPRQFPFLFPFESRYAFLQLTAFGYNRVLHRWQSQMARNQAQGRDGAGGLSSATSRYDDDRSLAHLVRLPRAKVRIARENILPSAFRVMELYGSHNTILEVEYFDEVGTGLGPTLEFYALTSREFARKDLHLWRDDNSDDDQSKYVYAPSGLFPAPLHESKLATAEGKGRLAAFKILGQFVAKALLDSRIIDCNFSPVFMRAVLQQQMTTDSNRLHGSNGMATLRAVDSRLAASLDRLLSMSAEDLEAAGLDFTLPGDDDFELKADGKQIALTVDNVQDYVNEVIDVTIRRGIQPMIRSFRAGFNSIFPIAAMASFGAEELVMLFGNTDEDWSESTLLSSIKPDHGYTADSAPFKSLITLMASFDLSERREFLQWLTGSPKLPIGGFSGLQPQLTVVKRPHEPPLKPDDYLASNMSCANFLKLPEYSSIDVMRTRLQTAVREGAGAFNLS